MINETDTKKGNSMDLNRQLIEAMADLNEDLADRHRPADGGGRDTPLRKFSSA